jgi:hypothetical protein
LFGRDITLYESIEDLYDAINSHDEEIRQSAVLQSKNFSIENVLSLLLQAIDDQDNSVRFDAVNILKNNATTKILGSLYQKKLETISINTLYDLIDIKTSIQGKTKQYSLEPMSLPTDSEKKSSIEKASLSETPQSSTSPQIIQNFNFNAPVDTVAGNVQGNLINHKEGKE